MRRTGPPPARWLCVLVSALACALGPASGQATNLQWEEECYHLRMIEVQRKRCLEEAQLENDTAGCSKMWDNLTCWPATPPGQVVVLACPLIFNLLSPTQGRNVSRSCTSEGWMDLEPGPYPVACGWDDKASDLDQQQRSMFYSSVKTGYTIGHSLSLAALLVATAILSLFRKLHCTRNYIHMHLFISFILRAASVFIKDLTLFDSEESDHCTKGSGMVLTCLEAHRPACACDKCLSLVGNVTFYGQSPHTPHPTTVADFPSELRKLPASVSPSCKDFLASFLCPPATTWSQFKHTALLFPSSPVICPILGLPQEGKLRECLRNSLPITNGSISK